MCVRSHTRRPSVRIGLAALAALTCAPGAGAQGRVLGEAQTLDGRAYALPELAGAVAAQGDAVVASTVTAVPAGGDHAQVFTTLAGARQLAPAAVLEPEPDGLGRRFGGAVALGAGRVVVADPEAALGALQGRVDSWALGPALVAVPRATLTPPEPGCAGFGVALASDGQRLAILSRAQGPDAVRCFVYTPAAGGVGWDLAARFAVPELATDLAPFGESVALSGARIVIGAPWRDAGHGRALVYHEDPLFGDWQLEAELAAPGFQAFGGEVALDGDLLLVGASEPIALAARGTVFAFRRLAGAWAQTQRLLPASSSAFDQFGAAIALRGGLAVIAAPGRPAAASASGGVDLWALSPLSNAWSPVTTIVDADAGPGDQLGLDVALDVGGLHPRVAYVVKRAGRVQGEALLLPAAPPSVLPVHATAGVTTCAPNGTSSLGTWAKLRALGSPLVAGNDLTLEAWDLAPSSWIVFGASDREVCTTLGPIGMVALGTGGQLARWQPNPASLSGVARLGVNLAGLPSSGAPLGTVPVVVGATWVFQGMYRDVNGGRLTEAVRVTFE